MMDRRVEGEDGKSAKASRTRTMKRGDRRRVGAMSRCPKGGIGVRGRGELKDRRG